MAKKRVHVIIEGRVQGVFFRAYTQEEATRMGLTGWVRNKTDGSVEAMVEGEADEVNMMIKWFHRGSPYADVRNVIVSEEEPVGDNKRFEIHRY